MICSHHEPDLVCRRVSTLGTSSIVQLSRKQADDSTPCESLPIATLSETAAAGYNGPCEACPFRRAHDYRMQPLMSESTLQLSYPEKRIALLTFDDPKKGANVLSQSVLEEFSRHLDSL